MMEVIITFERCFMVPPWLHAVGTSLEGLYYFAVIEHKVEKLLHTVSPRRPEASEADSAPRSASARRFLRMRVRIEALLCIETNVCGIKSIGLNEWSGVLFSYKTM